MGTPAADDPQFINSRKFLTTALSITVGIAWNKAVREMVDEVLGTDTGFGAAVYAVLVTVVVLLIFYTVNLTHWFHVDSGEDAKGVKNNEGLGDGTKN